MFYPQFQPQPQYQPQMQAPIQTQYQTQGIMGISSEEEALKYPVAPGNSIMFKIENQPLIIEKTMGLSQLDTPVIRYIDLVPRNNDPQPEYATKEDLELLREELLKKPVRKKVEENE